MPYTKVASEARRGQVWSPRPSCELSVLSAPHSWGTQSVAVGPPAFLKYLVLNEQLVCSPASAVLQSSWCEVMGWASIGGPRLPQRRRCPPWDSQAQKPSLPFTGSIHQGPRRRLNQSQGRLCLSDREGLRLACFGFFSPAHPTVLAKEHHCIKSDRSSKFKEVCASP